MEDLLSAGRWYRNPTYSVNTLLTVSSVVYLILTIIAFVISEILFAMEPSIFIVDAEYPTLKTASFFDTLPGTNMTKADLLQSTHNSFLCSFVGLAIVFYAFAFVTSAGLYVTREKLFEDALTKHCLLCQSVTERLKLARTAFLGKYLTRSPQLKRVSRQQYGLQSAATRKILPINSYEVSANLEDFIFSRVIQREYHMHVDAVLWLHDLVKTVDFMHSKKLFHLNLQPQSVNVHWLQEWTSDQSNSAVEDFQPNTLLRWVLSNLKDALREKGSSEDPDVRIVLEDLSHAVRSENGRVNARLVSAPDYYKPPECRGLFGDGREVDAAKVDAWGIGIIALEMFTGGFVKIFSDVRHSRSPADPPIVLPLDKIHFNNALFSMYGLKNVFLRERYYGIKFQTYDLDHPEFANDCFELVCALLRIDPNKRMDLKRVLELPLMKKVRRHLGDTYYVNYSF